MTPSRAIVPVRRGPTMPEAHPPFAPSPPRDPAHVEPRPAWAICRVHMLEDQRRMDGETIARQEETIEALKALVTDLMWEPAEPASRQLGG